MVSKIGETVRLMRFSASMVGIVTGIIVRCGDGGFMIFAEVETLDSQSSQSSKECCKAEMERRSEVEVVTGSPYTGHVSGCPEEYDGNSDGIRNTQDQHKRKE